MDLEAKQLINLSPIPELSEVELSTMLDQLSGLSDFNGDLTDRNVEDIIKEAEDILDKSISSKTNDSRSMERSLLLEQNVLSQDLNSQKEESPVSLLEFPGTNPISDIPVNDPPANTSSEVESNKHFNSPVGSPQTKVFSPGGSVNHIKSTIDSLKEFSTLIEKQLSSRSENSSPKCCKKTKQKEEETKEVTAVNNQPIISSEQVLINPKTAYPLDSKSNEIKSLDKSIKLLNCFERLYQLKPVRLTANKRTKMIDKAPKTTTKKKLMKDFKTCKKSNNSQQGSTVVEKNVKKNGKLPCHIKLSLDEGELLMYSMGNMKHLNSENIPEVLELQNETIHRWDHLGGKNHRQTQPEIDENLIIKVSEEVKEIKDQVKHVDEGSKATDRLKLDVKSAEHVEVSSGIQRLESKFTALKEKYDYQMGKLEAENLRLREELVRQKKSFECQIPEMPRMEDLRQNSPRKVQSVCSENFSVPRNSPCSSIENIHLVVKTTREAFCQTEEEEGRRKIEDNETKKTENKENVTGKKKPGKCKPFTEANVQRQKKISEHEEQLLATVRGLQAEVSAKDKETRKLKNEIESLRKQLKKLTVVKVENGRKCHIGTQTIGLGPVPQKPYNPAEYEATADFEKENDDLRTRIKALEEDFELLKEKRIADLRALHQVHEGEMTKLVSKLETQSALTRHLHSLLVNR